VIIEAEIELYKSQYG